MDTCAEYVNLHKGTSSKVDLLRTRTFIDIFSVAWTEIVSMFDTISNMVLVERSARSHLNVSCIDWAFKRMSLTQFAVHALLQGGTYNYFSLFKNKIAPYLYQALTQKEENEEAEKSGREPKQLMDFPTHQETVSEVIKDPFLNFKATLIIAPLKRKLIQEVPLPGPPIEQVITPIGPVLKIHHQNVDQTSQEHSNLPMPFSWANEVEA
ncbi:MAG: hypothetical protein GY861_10505, partial [bacterium]|nr:hypothetical protein [bacterium]